MNTPQCTKGLYSVSGSNKDVASQARAGTCDGGVSARVTLLMKMPRSPFDQEVTEHPWCHLAPIKAFGKMLDISTQSTYEQDGMARFPLSCVLFQIPNYLYHSL